METMVGASFQASSTCGVLHPFGEGLFGVALFEGVHVDGVSLGEGVLLQLEHALLLLVAQVGLGELGGEAVHAQEVVAELGGGADGGCAGVVELMHEAGGEGAEGGHLFLLDDACSGMFWKRMAMLPRMALRTLGQLVRRLQNCCSSNWRRVEGSVARTLAA